MIKVIEHGYRYRKYHTTCNNCKCYFEYEIDDVNNKGDIQCPDCKRNCHHCATLNADLTSKFKDKVEIKE